METSRSDFERDMAAYLRQLPSLLPGSVGKFALVGGGEYAGVFDSEADAVLRGYAQFGEREFLVQQVSESDEGLMSARSSVACPS